MVPVITFVIGMVSKRGHVVRVLREQWWLRSHSKHLGDGERTKARAGMNKTCASLPSLAHLTDPDNVVLPERVLTNTTGGGREQLPEIRHVVNRKDRRL